MMTRSSGPVKTRLEDPLLEDRQHTLPLRCAQAGGTAGNRTCVQAGHVASMLPELLSPLTHGHPTDAHAAGNFCLRQGARLQQSASFQTAFGTLTAGKMLRSPDHGRLL